MSILYKFKLNGKVSIVTGAAQASAKRMLWGSIYNIVSDSSTCMTGLDVVIDGGFTTA